MPAIGCPMLCQVSVTNKVVASFISQCVFLFIWGGLTEDGSLSFFTVPSTLDAGAAKFVLPSDGSSV